MAPKIPDVARPFANTDTCEQSMTPSLKLILGMRDALQSVRSLYCTKFPVTVN